MKSLPWIFIGIGCFLILVTEGNNTAIGIIAIIFLAIGAFPAYAQIKNSERQGHIKEINDLLYALGYTDEEVKERQAELNNYTVRDLKKIKAQAESELEEQKRRDFFEPIKRN